MSGSILSRPVASTASKERGKPEAILPAMPSLYPHTLTRLEDKKRKRVVEQEKAALGHRRAQHRVAAAGGEVEPLERLRAERGGRSESPM